MIRTATIAIVILGCVYAVHAFADGKKKQKNNVTGKAWDPYSCCHNMDDTPHRPVVLKEYCLVPEFYFFDTTYQADTSFVCECFDARDTVINPDTIHDFGSVKYIAVYKNFIDYAHTYKDYDGKEKPLPITNIIQRYDRLGRDKWMNVSYPGNKYAELREYKNDIVRVDTFINHNPVSNITSISICRYYKVVPVKK